MTLVAFLQSAFRHWILIAVASIAATCTGLLVARAQPAEFQTNGRFIIAPAPTIQDDNDIAQSLDALANRRAIVSTFGQVVLSPRTFDEAVAAAGLEPPQASRLKVSAVVSPEANVVEVFVRGPRRQLTERMLSHVGFGATRYFEGLYKLYAVSALDTGGLSTKQVAPRPALSAAVAGILGSGLGFLAGLARDWARSRRPTATRPPVVVASSVAGLRELPLGPTEKEGPLTGLAPGVNPPDRDSPNPGHALAVRPAAQISRHEPAHSRGSVDDSGNGPGRSVLEDPDWWLRQLYDVDREIRSWTNGSMTAGGGDDQRRWRNELDELSHLLGGWRDRTQEAQANEAHPDSSSER